MNASFFQDRKTSLADGKRDTTCLEGKFILFIIYILEYAVVQLYSWFKFYFPLFKLIIHHHTPKQRKIKFKPLG